MLNFSFCSPTNFVFGKGTESTVGELVKKYGGKKVLLHYGGGSIKRSGLFDVVVKALKEVNISFVELGGVKPNPVSSKVYEGIELCRKEGVDFVLAVGGGSVIDSSKAIAAGTVYNGDFLNFYKGKPIENALSVGTILTIPAAGSEGSPDSVITDESTMHKTGAHGLAIRPIFSILDPELTFTLPAYQRAAGITDIMAHVFERYFTKTKDVELTDRFCESVLLTMIKEAPRAMANANDYEAQANIMWAGTVAHTNLCGVDRVQDWASHDMEHELSSMYDVTHGAGLAVIFPAWMTYVMDKGVDKFAQIAVRVWGCEMNFEDPTETALAGISRFKDFLKKIGMPLTFAELGAREEDIPQLVKNTGVSDTVCMGGFTPLFAKDVENIYRLAL